MSHAGTREAVRVQDRGGHCTPMRNELDRLLQTCSTSELLILHGMGVAAPIQRRGELSEALERFESGERFGLSDRQVAAVGRAQMPEPARKAG